MKQNNIHIIGIPEGEEEEQGIENLFEGVMMQNFPNLVRESHRNPGNRESPKQKEPMRPTARHVIVKMAKFRNKERILKGETVSNIEGSPNKDRN